MEHKKEQLWLWKNMMCNRCTESPDNYKGERICTLDTGIIIHVGVM